ncbi:hypothetical protein [Aureivirga sp. CE67]|uniref:hypothetical protein n=1 Tax=Aureivirga sp. CE67 TaxID=1788983 RepID=UPI0018CA61BB|nr:hypothetical protein [Aureivirga sp. CE67]
MSKFIRFTIATIFLMIVFFNASNFYFKWFCATLYILGLSFMAFQFLKKEKTV